MEKIKNFLMLFAVLLSVSGLFAFKTQNRFFSVTKVGGAISNASGTITIANPSDVTGKTEGQDYRCTSADVICTVEPTIPLTNPLPNPLVLHSGEWRQVGNDGNFQLIP